ncbi:MAG: hypothetical protein JWM85_1784 [Acidimicrobiaceae bacterium]|nr:hypothetical protein [Acidimicrobiaceae bacterium]
MRKTSLLVAASVGAWAGWRASQSAGSLSNFRGVGPTRGRSDSPSSSGLSAGDAAEKVRALMELGRERGRVLLQQVLSGRNAA